MITIEKAAIIHDGKVFTGWRHDRIGLAMLKAKACKRPYPGGPAQGFVTSEGKFVDREEARKIAEAAGQGNLPPRYIELYSEDLWNPEGVPRNPCSTCLRGDQGLNCPNMPCRGTKWEPMKGCSTCRMFALYSSRGRVCPYMPCRGEQWVPPVKKNRIRKSKP